MGWRSPSQGLKALKTISHVLLEIFFQLANKMEIKYCLHGPYLSLKSMKSSAIFRSILAQRKDRKPQRKYIQNMNTQNPNELKKLKFTNLQ